MAKSRASSPVTRMQPGKHTDLGAKGTCSFSGTDSAHVAELWQDSSSQDLLPERRGAGTLVLRPLLPDTCSRRRSEGRPALQQKGSDVWGHTREQTAPRRCSSFSQAGI